MFVNLFDVLKILFIFISILSIAYSGVTLFRKNRPDGSMFVNDSNPEKDLYQLLVYTPIDELPNKRYLIFKVEKRK